MAVKRNEIAMTAAERVEFLDSQPFGVLATIGATGFPHQVNVGFVLDGDDEVVMSSFRSAQKVVNVQRAQQASLLVEVTAPYRDIRGALLSGTASIVDDPALVASWHYRMKDRTAALLPPDNLPFVDDEKILPKRVLIVLAVERAITWDHRKLGGVY